MDCLTTKRTTSPVQMKMRWYLDDEYCLLDHRMNGSTKILQNDIIRVYGRVVGTQQFERALTRPPVEIPVVEILYSDLIEE